MTKDTNIATIANMCTPTLEHANATQAETASNLAANLSRLARRKRVLSRLQWGLFSTALGYCLLGLFVLRFYRNLPSSSFLYVYALPLIATLLGVFVNSAHEETALVRALQAAQVAEALGALLEATRLLGMDHELLAAALTRALPVIEKSELYRLSREQRGLLFELIGWERKSPLGMPTRNWRPYRMTGFQLAALEAITKLGDPAAIPAVSWLAGQRRTHVIPLAWQLRGDPTAEVRTAAMRCLESIKVASEISDIRSTLLRPAGPTSDLLRPADSAAPDEAVLLRATTGRGE